MVPNFLFSVKFFGFEIFDSRIFLGKKICQVLFWAPLFKRGFFGLFKTIGRCVVVSAYPSHTVLWMKCNQTFFVVVLWNHLYNSPRSVLECIHQGFIQLISHASCLSTGFIVTEIPFCYGYSKSFSKLEIFKAQKFSMGFFRINFWSMYFFWVVLEALGIFFLVLIFTPIWSSPSIEIQSTPTPSPGALNFRPALYNVLMVFFNIIIVIRKSSKEVCLWLL